MLNSIRTWFGTALVAVFIPSTSTCFAGSHTWSGAVSGNWSVAGNWSSGGAPVAGETDVHLTFPASATRYHTTNNVGVMTVTALTFSGDNYSVRGNFALTLQGAGGLNVLVGGTNNVLASPVLFTGDVGVTVSSGNELFLDGQITGPGSLTKFGQGNLWLRPPFNNTWSGGTTVRDGSLWLASQGVAGTVALPGPVAIGTPSGTANPNVQWQRDDQIADGASVTVNTNAALTLNGYEDAIAALVLDSGSVYPGIGGPGALRLNGPFTGSGTSYLGADVRLNATRTFNLLNGVTTLAGSVLDGAGGAGGILKTGPGRLLLSASNAFTGPVTINQGVLQISHAQALGSTATGTTVGDGGTLSVLGGLAINGESLGLDGAGAGGQGALRAGGSGSSWAGSMGLGTDAVISVPNPAHAFTISSGISGFGRIIKQGEGTLVFSGSQANTAVGGVQVDAGTLNLQKLPGINAVAHQLIIGGTNDAPGSAVVQVFSDHQIADSTAVFVDYSGKLYLGVKSDTIGSLTLRGGTATSSSGTLTLNGDVTALPLFIGGVGQTNAIHGKLSLGNATRTFEVAGWLEVDAVISGANASAGLTKTGYDYFLVSGQNTFQGVTTIASGGLLALSDAALGATNGGTVVEPYGFIYLSGDRHISGEALSLSGPGFFYGTLASIGSNSWNGPITVATNVVFGVFKDDMNNIPGALSLGGVLGGGGALKKIGPGPLRLTGTNANTLTGALTVDEGELLLAKTNATAIAGPLVLGTTNSYNKTVFARQLAPNQIAPGAKVSVLPTAVLDLNGFNTLVGGLYLQAGDVTTGNGILMLNGDLVGDNFTQGQLNYGSTIAGRMALGGAAQLLRTTNDALVDIRANLMDGGGIGGMLVTGDGIISLGGTNTFQGPVEVNAGVLFIRSSQALGTPLFGTVVTNDATLILSGDNLTIAGEALTLAGGAFLSARLWNYGSNTLWTGAVTFNGTTSIDSAAPDSSLELRGSIGGPGGFTANGAGRIVFSGSQPNSYTGETRIAQGTLLLAKTNTTAISGPLVLGDPWFAMPLHQTVRYLRPNQIADTVRVTVHRGVWTYISAQLDLNGFSDTIGSLEGAGDVILGTGQITTGADGGDSGFSGVLTGSGATGLVKTGGGVFTLSGQSPCSGATLVNQGTLLVNGSLSNSAVTVAATGAIGGGGSVKALTLSGAARPGPTMDNPSYARLTSLGSLNFAPGSHFYCELGGLNPGSDCDQFRASGSVVLNNNILNLSQHFNPGPSNQFKILDIPTGGVAMGTFAGLAEGAQFSIAPGRTFQITYQGGDGNDVVLTQVAAPQTPTLTDIAKTPLGPMQLTGTGTPGVSYDVYATTNLASTNWLKLGPITADGAGQLQFVDNDSQVLPMRFYRFALP